MSYSEYRAPTEAEQQIRYLKDELFKARWTIINLAPEEFHSMLGSFYHCENREQAHGWQLNVAEQLIQGATSLRHEEGSLPAGRAYCPLCGNGTSSPFESGFTLPEGLRRHLVGFGRIRQCSVMNAASKLAQEHWNENFREQEQAERVQALARLEERQKSETLYRLGPGQRPVLFDDALTYSWRPARTESELSWAEQRLATLGFKALTDGRIKAYIKDHGEFVVYADPRAQGEISFRLHLTGPAKKKRALRIVPRFNIRDSWKNDLLSKYERRCAQALLGKETPRNEIG